MPLRPRQIDAINYLIGLMIFAAGSSWLFVASGYKLQSVFGMMFAIALGPFLEHLFERTSTERWIFDLVVVVVLLGMIFLRYRRDSKYLVGFSYIGVVLWYTAAFITLVNHGE